MMKRQAQFFKHPMGRAPPCFELACCLATWLWASNFVDIQLSSSPVLIRPSTSLNKPDLTELRLNQQMQSLMELYPPHPPPMRTPLLQQVCVAHHVCTHPLCPLVLQPRPSTLARAPSAAPCTLAPPLSPPPRSAALSAAASTISSARRPGSAVMRSRMLSQRDAPMRLRSAAVWCILVAPSPARDVSSVYEQSRPSSRAANTRPAASFPRGVRNVQLCRCAMSQQCSWRGPFTLRTAGGPASGRTL